RTIFDAKRDVAVGVDEELRVPRGVERKTERERQPDAVVVAERELVADARLKRAIGSTRVVAAGAVPGERDADRSEVERVRRLNQIALIADDGDLTDVLRRRRRAGRRRLRSSSRQRGPMLPELFVHAAAPRAPIVDRIRLRSSDARR